MTTHIGKHPLPEMYGEGLEIDCQCARCGSSCDWQECVGDGCYDGVIEDFEDDGLDGLSPRTKCPECEGRGGTQRCMSSHEWCEANPLPGRESVKRGAIEWFTISERNGDL